MWRIPAADSHSAARRDFAYARSAGKARLSVSMATTSACLKSSGSARAESNRTTAESPLADNWPPESFAPVKSSAIIPTVCVLMEAGWVVTFSMDPAKSDIGIPFRFNNGSFSLLLRRFSFQALYQIGDIKREEKRRGDGGSRHLDRGQGSDGSKGGIGRGDRRRRRHRIPGG